MNDIYFVGIFVNLFTLIISLLWLWSNFTVEIQLLKGINYELRIQNSNLNEKMLEIMDGGKMQADLNERMLESIHDLNDFRIAQQKMNITLLSMDEARKDIGVVKNEK